MDPRSLFDMRNHGGEEGDLPFAVVSGNFPENGVALPIGNRKVRASALREFYVYKGKTPSHKVKIKFLQFFNFAFIWNLIFPNKFFAAVGPQKENFLSFLSGRMSNVNSEWSHIAFSIYVGSRKFLLPLFEGNTGALLGYAKIYLPGVEREYGENESATLKALEKIDLGGVSVPKVLFEGDYRGFFILVLSPAAQAENFEGIAPAHAGFLKELSEKTGEDTPFESSSFAEAILREVAFLKEKMPAQAELVEYFHARAKEGLRGKLLRFSLVKREFPYFEMLKSQMSHANGQWSHMVLDWEQARSGFPPAFDLFSLLMSGARYKRGGYAEAYRKNLMDIFFTANEKTSRFADPLFAFW